MTISLGNGAALGPMIIVTHEWYCPNCHLEDVTHEPRPHTRFHTCPALRGLTAPMLPKGVAAKLPPGSGSARRNSRKQPKGS